MLVTLSLGLAVAGEAAQPALAIPEDAKCDVVQAMLLQANSHPKVRRGKWPRFTFTGRCRYDLYFSNVERPYDIARLIDDQRPVLEGLIRNNRWLVNEEEWPATSYSANIRIDDLGNVEVLNESVNARRPPHDLPSYTDQLRIYIGHTLGRAMDDLPEHGTILWHFVYPLNTRAWLDDEFPFTIPEPPQRPEVIPVGPDIEDP